MSVVPRRFTPRGNVAGSISARAVTLSTLGAVSCGVLRQEGGVWRFLNRRSAETMLFRCKEASAVCFMCRCVSFGLFRSRGIYRGRRLRPCQDSPAYLLGGLRHTRYVYSSSGKSFGFQSVTIQRSCQLMTLDNGHMCWCVSPSLVFSTGLFLPLDDPSTAMFS